MEPLKNFFYLNQGRIDDYYSQLHPTEASLTKSTVETTGRAKTEKTKDDGAKLSTGGRLKTGPVEASMDVGVDSRKGKREEDEASIKITEEHASLSSSARWNEIEAELQKNELLIKSAERYEYDDHKERIFLQLCDDINTRVKTQNKQPIISDDVKRQIVEKLKSDLASSFLNRLTNGELVPGRLYVFSGEFFVSPQSGDTNSFRLSYDHPVGDLLSPKKKVCLSFTLELKYCVHNWLSVLVAAKSVRVNIVANYLSANEDGEQSTVQYEPITIYT